MQTLTYTMGSDNRPLVADIQDFSIDFAEAGIKNWVQARQYESSMRQVFLNIKNEDGSPFDLTGANIWFEGLTPDGHRVIFDRQYVPIDPTAGQARIDFLAPAFAVAGSYKQSFFRIYRNGENISTLEFKFSVLADKVISGIVSSDYIQPFEAAYSDLLDIVKKADGDIKSQLATWTTQFTDLMTQLSKQGTDTSTMLTNLQTNIESLETQIKSDGLLKQEDVDKFESNLMANIGDMAILKNKGVTLVDKVLNELNYRGIDVEWYGAVGDGVTDDYAAIQKAIDENHGAIILLKAGATYAVSKTIDFENTFAFDGRLATIKLIADADYVLKINTSSSNVRNIMLSKDPATKASGIYIHGNAHNIENIQSKNCIWTDFIHCIDMKEAHLRSIRVDNDVTGSTGNIIQMDHCLNNTISDSFIGYADNGIYMSNISSEVSATDSEAGYENEGLTLSNVVIVSVNIALNVQKCTFLTANNCLFDFCANYGVYLDEGFGFTLGGTWIQVTNPTSICVAIAAGSTFGSVNLHDNTFVGEAENTSQSAVNLDNLSSQVVVNNILLTIKGGKVGSKMATVQGNVVENGIGFYGYKETQIVSTYYPTSTAHKAFVVKNSSIEFIATELGTDHYLSAVGNVDSAGKVNLTAVGNNGIAIGSVNDDGSVVIVNDAKDYTKMELVCKIYPFDHKRNNNEVIAEAQ